MTQRLKESKEKMTDERNGSADITVQCKMERLTNSWGAPWGGVTALHLDMFADRNSQTNIQKCLLIHKSTVMDQLL